MNTQIADRAVVIGASIAGLLTAHVLADSYALVTVIDRDELPERPAHRRGVLTAGISMRSPPRATSVGGTAARAHRRSGRRWGPRR